MYERSSGLCELSLSERSGLILFFNFQVNTEMIYRECHMQISQHSSSLAKVLQVHENNISGSSLLSVSSREVI